MPCCLSDFWRWLHSDSMLGSPPMSRSAALRRFRQWCSTTKQGRWSQRELRLFKRASLRRQGTRTGSRPNGASIVLTSTSVDLRAPNHRCNVHGCSSGSSCTSALNEGRLSNSRICSLLFHPTRQWRRSSPISFATSSTALEPIFKIHTLMDKSCGGAWRTISTTWLPTLMDGRAISKAKYTMRWYWPSWFPKTRKRRREWRFWPRERPVYTMPSTMACRPNPWMYVFISVEKGKGFLTTLLEWGGRHHRGCGRWNYRRERLSQDQGFGWRTVWRDFHTSM